jgi:GWxTD domain-containing protein
MRNRLFILYVITGVIVIFVLACVSTYDVPLSQSQINYVSIYDPSSSNMSPEVMVRHMKGNETVLFFKVNPQNLMSKSLSDGSASEQGFLDIKYAVRDVESKKIVDSASVSYSVIKNSTSFITYIPLKLKSGKLYSASVIFMDKYKQSWKRVLLDIDKKSTYAGEYFFPEYLYPELEPVFRNYVEVNTPIRIHSDVFENDSLNLFYLGRDILIPFVAYSQRVINPFVPEPKLVDRMFPGDTIIFKEIGYYKLLPDSNSISGGYDIYVGDLYYPFIRTPEAMLPPLQYFITESQYRILSKSDSLKKGIDKFWLETGGSVVAAKELIRIYYNRVQLANQYFTNTRPGWQTDRGMIYIIFGIPKKVYKDRFNEQWIYSETDVSSSLMFQFTRDTVSTTTTDFILKRDQRYQEAWNQAILTWRNGKAYSIR